VVDVLRDRVALQNEIIAVRQRLLEIEAQERDALSIELQKAQLEAENKRAAGFSAIDCNTCGNTGEHPITGEPCGCGR
jgi:hypothetical protein